MRVEKEGYEYRGFKLGQKVRLKEDEKEYKIIGFDENAENCFIALNVKQKYANNIYWTVMLEDMKNKHCFWVTPEQLEIIEMTEKNKDEKETVLEIEYVKVFEKYFVRISKQNYDILKRNNFRDDELNVSSLNRFHYSGETLYLNGNDIDFDNEPIYMNKRTLDNLIELIEKINKKYGIPKTTPKEDYDKFEEVEFKPGDKNYFIYFNEEDKVYYVDSYKNYNTSLFGLKHISREDAEKFCNKWNKINKSK